MTISTRFPRTSQPQEMVGVDWSNPLARDLVSCYVPGVSLQDFAKRSPEATRVNNPETRLDTVGKAVLTASSGNKYISVSKVAGGILDITGNISCFGLIKLNSQPTPRSPIISCLDNTNGYYLDITTDPSIRFLPSPSGGATYVFSPPLNKVHAITGTYSTLGSPKSSIYFNGELKATDNTYNLASTTATRVAIGARPDFDAVNQLDGTIYIAAIWRRTLTATEVASLSANPWQLFTPIEKPIFSTIDYAKIRGPKQKQVTRTSQPQIPVRVASEIWPNCDAWLPASGAANLNGGQPLTFNPAFYTPSIGIAGAAMGRTGANFNDAITLPTGGAYNSVLLVINKCSSSSIFGGIDSYRLNGSEETVIDLIAASGSRLTGTLLVKKGSVIYARWKEADYVICHKDNKGNIEYLTNIVTAAGNGNPVGAARSGDAAFALISRFRNIRHSETEIRSLVANPWQIFAPIEQPMWLSEGLNPSQRGPKQRQVTRTQQPQGITPLNTNIAWATQFGAGAYLLEKNKLQSAISTSVFNSPAVTGKYGKSSPYVSSGGGGGVVGYNIPLTNIDSRLSATGDFTIIFAGKLNTLTDGATWTAASLHGAGAGDSRTIGFTASAGTSYISFSNSVSYSVTNWSYAYTANQEAVIVWVRKGSVLEIYVNGAFYSSAAIGNIGTFTSAASVIGSAAAFYPAMSVSLLACSTNKALDGVSLSANPWQLFAPIEQPLFLSEGNQIQNILIPPRFRQVTRTTQPQTSVKINPKFDKLGITSTWIGSDSSREIVNNGITSTTGAGVSSNFTKIGKTAIFSSNTIGEHIKVAPNVNTLFSSEATILVFRRCLDTTSRENTVFGYNYDSGRRVSAHVPWSDGTVYFDFGTLDGVGRITAAGYTKDLLPEVLVFVAGSVKGREIWRRGSLLARNTGINGPRDTSIAATPFRIGATEDISSRSDLVEVALVVTANRAWSDAEIQEISANPWQLFAPIEKPIFLSQGTQAAPEAQTFNAAVTLSGLQVLSSIGVLTALGVLDVTTSLSGLGITSNVGTLSTSTAVTGSVTGLQMTASVGAAVGFSSATVTLDGRQASTALGALTAQTSAILTLTGVASVASHGVIGAVGSSSSTGVVLGIGTTAGIGTINATTSATYTLTGLVNAAQVGTIGTATAIQTTLVGTGTTASRGTISSTGGASTTISGTGLTSNRGVLTVTTSVAQALGGLGTTSNVGTINADGTRSVSTTLVGQGSASNRGIITANTSVVISFNGVQVAVSTGTVSAAGTTSASTGLIGVEVTATLGNITAEGNFPYTISLRYYTVDSEDNIFIADSKSNEYVSESRNALVDLSANRDNVFVADSKSNEFTSDSRNSSLDASPARNIVFVSGSRNNIFTTITRDQ